jgi:lipopolysaccharide export system ATP-binding protein
VAEERAAARTEATPVAVADPPHQIEVLAELASAGPEPVDTPAVSAIAADEHSVASLASSSSPARPARLVAEHLRKQYGARVVVKDVSLTVEAGEVVGLLGPNGAGKTTCFYMVVGLVPMDGGTITLDSESIAHLPIHRRARRGLSYLPQEASVFRRLTVEENVRAVLELQIDDKDMPLAADLLEQQLDALLVDLQIEHLRTNSAQSLSGGERRRVEIARALAAQPRFILLDEPFAGIDPIAVIEIQRIVRFLKERGIGVLITDHNVRETLGICDHAYIINEGQVLAAGAPRDIIDNDSVRRVYLGEHFRM